MIREFNPFTFNVIIHMIVLMYAILLINFYASYFFISSVASFFFFFLALSRYFLGEGNGTPLQYTCLENPWTEEPGRLQSMGSLRVGHDWVTSVSLFTFMHWRRKWQPTLVFLPGESQGQRSLMGCCLWGRTDRTQLKRLNSSSSSSRYFLFHHFNSFVIIARFTIF